MSSLDHVRFRIRNHDQHARGCEESARDTRASWQADQEPSSSSTPGQCLYHAMLMLMLMLDRLDVNRDSDSDWAGACIKLIIKNNIVIIIIIMKVKDAVTINSAMKHCDCLCHCAA